MRPPRLSASGLGNVTGAVGHPPQGSAARAFPSALEATSALAPAAGNRGSGPRIVPGSQRIVDPDEDLDPGSFVAYAANTPVRR